ncbi:hypothetical protein PPMP20_19680 [Paraburkholderia phymatum]|uniref:Uncharacterized protein n=1 Tax=Paraburkholderia phymatum (strain DSM 17167 / CIP 108236 / LMG 21445 / STM815) TaxID=391038 RepID=B2JUD6_PARP8|nr:hypothetical protein [Paraburkholderia phymatum]ACC74658.1 hypothetical protein Bphy_5583 [Paraburkholderia phymatum STM815]
MTRGIRFRAKFKATQGVVAIAGALQIVLFPATKAALILTVICSRR